MAHTTGKSTRMAAQQSGAVTKEGGSHRRSSERGWCSGRDASGRLPAHKMEVRGLSRHRRGKETGRWRG
jgi:hypothetical protein